MAELPRNSEHSLFMYSYSALGSHATVTLNESSLTNSSRFPCSLVSPHLILSSLAPPSIKAQIKEDGEEKTKSLNNLLDKLSPMALSRYYQ
jgi:hypothetical protein